MVNFCLRTYRLLFGGKCFYKFNRFLYALSLRGLGIMNYENDQVSGEECFVKNLFRDDASKVVFDVGANKGDYSQKILKYARRARVYAFEPHPLTYQSLKDSVNSDRFHCYNSAVGATNGETFLYDYENGNASQHASVYKGVIETLRKSKAVRHKVGLITLTDFAKQNSIDFIDFLKIDTEGGELEVLKGFAEYLRDGKVGIIQFEFNDAHVMGRAFFKDFWDALPNYSFFRMLPDGLVPIKSYDPLFCEIFAFQNIVAILNK